MPVKKATSKKKLVVSKETSRLASARSKNNDLAVRAKSRTTYLSIPVYSLAGRAAGTMVLPKEIFGSVVNKKLLAQALRVYFANQQSHPGSTKTRGQVRGSTAKIYRQKGTGRARHGAITAPIFVGGGIVFGPTKREVKLNLPQKMKKAALVAALSDKMGDKGILGISGIEKASGKTKEMAKLMSTVYSLQSTDEHSSLSDKKQKKISALIVTAEKMDNVVRGVRNIPGVDVIPANQLNAYEVLKHQVLLLTKDSIGRLGDLQNEKKDSGRASLARMTGGRPTK